MAIAGRASIGGGEGNRATGHHATINGGRSNTALFQHDTVGGGAENIAGGEGASVPGGFYNQALGFASFAAGYGAVARGSNMFVWSDRATPSTEFDPATIGAFGATPSNLAPLHNTFVVRATGGFQLITGVNTIGAITSRCFIAPGGSGCNCVSDRNAKHAVKTVSPRSMLAQLIAVPVSIWACNGNERRYIGPMAQDFFSAFGLGDSDRAINSMDAQRVAFAAIQGLNQLVNEKDAEIATLKADTAAIKTRLGM